MPPNKQNSISENDDNIACLLQKLVVYTKLANYDVIRKYLLEVLDTNDKKRVFQATDGHNSVRDIQSATGVSKDTVSNWWNDWQQKGIVEETGEARGRRCKVLSLSEFGIEIPAGKKKAKK